MFVFGGFSGVLLNDVLAYTPPSCHAFYDSHRCASAGPGLRCVWARGRCGPWDSRLANGTPPAQLCPPRSSTHGLSCS